MQPLRHPIPILAILLATLAGCTGRADGPSHIYLRTRACVDGFSAMKIVLRDSANRATEIPVTDESVIEEVREMIQESVDEVQKMGCRNTIVLLCGNRPWELCYSGDFIKYQGATARADGVEELINEYLAAWAEER